jgi:NAD(P)-dependent dehydrogenase (short-subunit alcohol dehydrogenase family)
MALKPIRQQVVVVAGAASGIGRETALRFARRGAKVVAAARSEPALRSLVRNIEARGGAATYAVCDVANFDEVRAVAELAARSYGRIDTWVNVAAVSIYATFEDTTPEEFRRVIDVNLMGQVHGAKAALPYLRREGRGALICISSVEARFAMPLQSAYAASKHAIQGFLEALRCELRHDGVPISVTDILPATINTPLFDNARTKIGVKPKGPPPYYQPGLVADCVLHAAEHPVRELYAGGAGRMMVLGHELAPALVERAMSRVGFTVQRTDEPKSVGDPDNLFQPRADEDRVEGDFSHRARDFSIYDWIETHPGARALLASGVLGGAALLLARRPGARSARAAHPPPGRPLATGPRRPRASGIR